MESAGPISLGLEPTVKGSGMTLRTRRVWFCGLPLAGASADAEVVPDEHGWSVRVRLRLAALNLVLSYDGYVEPLWEPR
jgi:hypothetical protein